MKVSLSCNAISFRFLTLAIKPNESEFQFWKWVKKWVKKCKKVLGFFCTRLAWKSHKKKKKGKIESSQDEESRRRE